MWADLLRIHDSIGSQPWLLAGDFNAIMALKEYRGPSNLDLNSISDFAAFHSATDLQEFSTSGGTFTRTGVRRGGSVWKKLDRAFFNMSWLQYFNVGYVELLRRVTSDHNPMLLRVVSSSTTGPKSFRFQEMWLSRPDFLEVVRGDWEHQVQGYGMYAFHLKLHLLLAYLQEWNSLNFGNVFATARQIEDQVRHLEEKFDRSQSVED